MKSMTFRDLQDLPPTVDLMTAACALGIGRSKAYQLARDGEFPVRIIRIGDLMPSGLAALGLLASACAVHFGSAECSRRRESRTWTLSARTTPWWTVAGLRLERAPTS